jgi:DNA gyrase subunit A
MVVTRNGYGKRTRIPEYTVQGRYGQGMRTLKRTSRTGLLAAMRSIEAEGEIMLISRGGIMLRTTLESIRETGRDTQGVILMDVSGGDEVAGIAILGNEDEDDENDEIDESPDGSVNGGS